MFRRISLVFLVVTLATFFIAQPVDAAKGPKITSKVYFDIKHGDKDLGRSTWSLYSIVFLTIPWLIILSPQLLWVSLLYYAAWAEVPSSNPPAAKTAIRFH